MSLLTAWKRRNCWSCVSSTAHVISEDYSTASELVQSPELYFRDGVARQLSPKGILDTALVGEEKARLSHLLPRVRSCRLQNQRPRLRKYWKSANSAGWPWGLLPRAPTDPYLPN